MRASALCCVLSCLASSALAVHHPLHRHRPDKQKRTEVLVVEEEPTVEDNDVTIYLPGPPPAGYKQHLREKKKKHEHEEYLLTAFKSFDGSETVVSKPKPSHSGSGKGAGSGKLHVPPSNLSTTNSATRESGSSFGSGSDSASGSSPGSSSLVGGGATPFASPKNTDSKDATPRRQLQQLQTPRRRRGLPASPWLQGTTSQRPPQPPLRRAHPTAGLTPSAPSSPLETTCRTTATAATPTTSPGNPQQTW